MFCKEICVICRSRLLRMSTLKTHVSLQNIGLFCRATNVYLQSTLSSEAGRHHRRLLRVFTIGECLILRCSVWILPASWLKSSVGLALFSAASRSTSSESNSGNPPVLPCKMDRSCKMDGELWRSRAGNGSSYIYVCMCVCVYIYIYIHTHAHTHM